MCGIFGSYNAAGVLANSIRSLAKHAEQRGVDSSGLFYFREGSYELSRADTRVTLLLNTAAWRGSTFLMGHSRLVTNGEADNQPIVKSSVVVIHNGIVVNDEEIWPFLEGKRQLQVDTEVIAQIAQEHLNKFGSLSGVSEPVFRLCQGAVSCAIAAPSHGELALISNTGSMYLSRRTDGFEFASESYALQLVSDATPKRILNEEVILAIPASELAVQQSSPALGGRNLLPKVNLKNSEASLLVSTQPDVVRCTRCILPTTMPFIRFDSAGVCNYCLNYKIRTAPKSLEELDRLVREYRRTSSPDVIIPFSGGRDSSFGLHLVVRELGMNPITFTYDWGMITDLGRRNASLMSAKLGVENIIVAADIVKKRKNIAMNLKAWLAKPNLGMVSILTAGDKHFFKYVDTVKRQTGVDLNLWGINPLEVTHFKSGFLGVAPDFEETRVYTSSAMKQLNYQSKRLSAMLESPGYFNSSLVDTVSGEYWRSFAKKADYFHIFDYWRWDEQEINNVLLNEYDWETAPDTSTTWRIGDGTAGFYNYVYYTIAGLTEHDTLRSNQIREGQITREEALSLVADENQPRYENIKWYLDSLGFDFSEVIKTVNGTKRLY
jgi:glucosamine--fructose-6-phosphate aminotransferase (isomerizing)